MQRSSIRGQRVAPRPASAQKFATPALVTTTPLGQTRGARGVDDVSRLPLVDRTASIRITHRRARFCRAPPATVFSSSRTTHVNADGNPASTSLSARPSTAPESEIMWAIRSTGYVGSTGTNAAPVFTTAHRARTESAERGIAIATRSSGPTPFAIRTRASRDRPLVEFAVADRLTVEANRIRRRIHSGRRCEDLDQGSRGPTDLHEHRPAHPARPHREYRCHPTTIEGTDTTVSRIRTRRRANPSTVETSNRSAANVNSAESPCWIPSSPIDSVTASSRSNLAVVVSISAALIASPGCSNAVCARFCKDSTTWKSGCLACDRAGAKTSTNRSKGTSE